MNIVTYGPLPRRDYGTWFPWICMLKVENIQKRNRCFGINTISMRTHSWRALRKALEAVISIRFTRSCKKEFIREFDWVRDSCYRPCGGGVEYLRPKPASRRKWRKGKSQIWDSKIWSQVPRDSDHRMTALARTSSYCKRQTRPLVRESAPHQQTRNCLTVMKIWS
jgi:hypothetical protein